MIKVGVTGNIGSGKSTVCKVFENFGFPIYFADQEAKKLMENDPLLVGAIKETFGNDIYLNEKIDRKKLAGIVFQNPRKLKKLNHMVHPAVHKDLAKWFSEKKKQGHGLAIEEAALIFEAGQASKLDKIITVVVPKDIALQRAASRDRSKITEIEKRWDNQMSQIEKARKSDGIILNDGKHSLILQVQNLIKRWEIPKNNI